MFQFNLRSRTDEKISNADRFAMALKNVAGKLLTRSTLTWKERGSAEPF